MRPAAERAPQGAGGPAAPALHIADVTMFWGPASGGVRRYIDAKRRWLAAQAGCAHSVVVPARAAHGDGGGRAGTAVPVPSLPLPLTGYRLARSRGAAARVLTALAPDLIEAGDPYTLAWAALDAAQALRVPAVAFAHSDLSQLAARIGGAAAEAVACRYLRRLYGRFDRVLAPSRALAERLRAIGVARVSWQPLGVDCRVFTPAARDPSWRSRLPGAAAQPGARLLLYAGRFAPEKNLALLAQAVERLGAPHVLLLLGAGPAAPRPAPHVIHLAFEAGSARLARALASVDAFVHAGDIETFGLAPLEALACGTPVVARAAGGLAELVDDTVGAAVSTGSAGAFAEAIAAVLARPRAALALAARARALRHDWDAVLPPLLALYRGLHASSPAAAAATRRAPLLQPMELRG